MQLLKPSGLAPVNGRRAGALPRRTLHGGRCTEGAARRTLLRVVQDAGPRPLDPQPISPVAEQEDSPETCPVFIDRDGEILDIMCCDYGFRSGVGRMYSGEAGEIPLPGWRLALDNFADEYRGLRRSFRFDEYSDIATAVPPQGLFQQGLYAFGKLVVKVFAATDRVLEGSNLLGKLQPATPSPDVLEKESNQLTSQCMEIRQSLSKLTLSNKAVWDREHAREQAGGGVETPLPVKVVYLSLCLFLDFFYVNRPIARFWFLETVARMPYFSYITMLHLYESFGWWRAGAELRKVHFAEEWNELHHLQIMESLGGDRLWIDRFAGQHAAIIYYWVLLGLFFFSPKLAYNFSELIEAHAVDTYGQFADENEQLLKDLPPPLCAATYYRSEDLYMFDAFQTAAKLEPRRPECNTLYDVFCNIRDDEGEHVQTMAACQDSSFAQQLKDMGS